MIDFTKGNVTKNILMFTIPILLSNIFQQFYNIADFFIINKETGSAQKYKTPKVIKERLSDIIILLISTRKHSFLLLLSATKRETAIWIPPQLRAMQKTSTGKINWKTPIPLAPIRLERNILYKKPIILLKRLAMVRIIVPLIIGFLLSIV